MNLILAMFIDLTSSSTKFERKPKTNMEETEHISQDASCAIYYTVLYMATQNILYGIMIYHKIYTRS